MKIIARMLTATVLLSGAVLSWAYDPYTHEELSAAAVDVSVLKKKTEVLADLGLKPLADLQTFPSSQGNPRTVVQLFREGASFEDNDKRPLNHFFDPLRDQALLPYGVSLLFNHTSPDWALEDTKDIDKQDFSYKDARYYLYLALTATNEDDRSKYFGLTFQSLGQVIHHPQDMAQPQHVRNDAHLDQPKEFDIFGIKIPNPAYNPSGYEKYTLGLGANLSIGPYPKVRFDSARRYWHTEDKNPGQGQGVAEFTNSNFVSAGTNFRGAYQNGLIAKPNERYAFPAPARPPRYEDANALLTSVKKQVPAECLPPAPPCVMGFVASEIKDNYRPQEGGMNPKAATASIFDQDLELHGETAKYPDLDNCTTPKPGTPPVCPLITTNQIYTLNRFNFDTALNILLTRAVAYSAGLIDYFFRGRLEVQDAGYTDTGVSLRIKNAIDPDAEPVWKNETLTTGGELRVAFDYKLDGKLVVGASTPAALTEDIKPGMASAGLYSFTLPEIPDTATEVRYRLVYRGRIGKEDGAVAVGAFKPMSGFVVAPNYVPTDGITTANETRFIYRPHGANAKWKLSPEKNIKAGNVDWRGWYVNGNPTKLLTWVGARARYMPDRQVCMYHPAGCRWVSSSVTGQEIYQGGEVFAKAPGDVLGASVTRDSQGKDWLVVITLDGPNLGEVVWRRPYEKNISPDTFDPAKAPKGWQEIGRFKGSDYSNAANRINHHADIPWFFNGSGTRAQTMRRWWDTSNNSLVQRADRLEITIVDDVTRATFTNHQNLAGILSSSTCSSSYDADGAGSGSRNSTGNGELVVAVDFGSGDDAPLLAKVKVESSGNTASSVSVTKDNNGRVTSTSGRRDATGNQKDTLFWGDGTSLTIVDGSYKFKSEWFSGSGTSTYSHADESSTREMEIGYYFDLRYKLFSYYVYGNSDKTNLSIVDGARTNTGSGTFSESHRIDSAIAGSQVPYTFESSYALSPNEPATYALSCSSSDTRPSTTTYGYNFPWFFETTSAHNVGLWAVDLNKRVLVSQYMVSDFGYADAGSYNALISNDTPPVQPLSVIIPGGNDKSVYFSPYFPIGVVR